MLTKPREAYLADELENFKAAAKVLKPSPGELSSIAGIDIHGASIPLKDSVGGDHIIYVDFDRRYNMARRIEEAENEGKDDVAERLRESRRRVGILVADVSGHQVTDALIAAMLHQAFLLGAYYELDRFGEITTGLFEHLNTRFFNSLSFKKYITLIYGEVSSTGMFRFLSAGGPPPLVFSAEYDRFVTLSSDRLVSFTPLGIMPSEDDVDIAKNMGPIGYKPRYTVNEVNLLGAGDILVLYTDGLSEHALGEERPFVPDELEATIRSNKHRSAQDIYEALSDRVQSFAPIEDDMTVVIIKKTRGGV
ncbi:MAG: PP2C family protein-serine/threonine phosphatase [Thermoanaerobaculia bacterium]